MWNEYFPEAVTIAALLGVVVLVLNRGGWKLFRRMDEPLSRRVDVLTLELVEVRLLLSEVLVGTAILIGQLEAAGIEPDYRPPSRQQVVEKTDGEESDVVRLHRLLAKHFSLAELAELASSAGIPDESYNGSTREARALGLVQYASRHQQLERLVESARKARPKVSWPWVIREGEK